MQIYQVIFLLYLSIGIIIVFYHYVYAQELIPKKSKIITVEFKTSEAVLYGIFKAFKGEIVHTITLDNGKEFSCHKKISEYRGCKVYFAHPYSSYERGLNENTNGLIRQYFPKKTDFRQITHKDMKRVEFLLNHRPRKTLGFLSPNEFHRKKMIC